jgi:hypothetical protein
MSNDNDVRQRSEVGWKIDYKHKGAANILHLKVLHLFCSLDAADLFCS